MTTATAASRPTGTRTDERPAGLLALALQEAFTVTIRLRANRQVAADADSFRGHVKRLLAAADAEARQAGYGGEYVRLAIYAYIAFLDESILNADQPMFASWPRQPLQEEVFGDQLAGERFYRYLDDLLGAPDSTDVADVLEVFQLCMLLGFRGRHAQEGTAGLHGRLAAAEQKILRIRGEPGALAPSSPLPADDVVAPPEDPWIPRLGALAAIGVVTALVLFLLFRLLLAPDGAALRALTSTLAG